jgi:hypothetical protein
LAPTTEVGCGLHKYSTFSEKCAKTLTIFFFIFLNFFSNFDETKQDEANCCWAWVTLKRWSCADRRICGAMGRHTIWHQGLAINECWLAIVQSGFKVQIIAVS